MSFYRLLKYPDSRTAEAHKTYWKTGILYKFICISYFSVFVKKIEVTIAFFATWRILWLLERYFRVRRAGGRKRLWGQLNNSKTVRDKPYVSAYREIIGTHWRAIDWAHTLGTPNRGVANWRPHIWAHHVGSSSDLTTIVVMTLLFIEAKHLHSMLS